MNNENVKGARLGLIIVALMASLLLSALDTTIVSTAMKTIVGELSGMALYVWPFTIYMLCSTVIIPISGGLADLFGRKPIFLTGIFTFVVGSIFCGASPSMTWLIIFRGVQGLGGGIITTSVFTIVADLFPPHKRGKYMGIVTSVFALSSIIGPLLGGLITDYLSWRWVFYVNVPISIIAIALVVPFMPNFKTTGRQNKIDIKGTVLIILALVPMLLAFSFAGSTYAWGSVQIIGMLAFSAIMLALFAIAESKAQNPIIPMSFFKNRCIWLTLLVAFFSNAVMYAVIIYIPYFVQGILGQSATTSGAVTVPMTIALMITSNIIGFFATERSTLFRFLTMLAFALAALGAFLLSGVTAASSYFSVIVFMVITGAGIGFTMPITNTNVQNAAPIEQLAAATGAVTFFRTIGSTIGTAVYGTIMATSMASGFASLNLSGVPEAVRASLSDPQVITDAGAVSQIIGQTPPEQAAAVQTAVGAAKDVLLGGIQNIFLFCAIVCVAAIVVSFFFKPAPMKVIHLDKADGCPTDEAEPNTPGA